MIKKFEKTVYQCPFCEKVYLTERGVYRHINWFCKENDNSLRNNKEKQEEVLGIPLFPEV